MPSTVAEEMKGAREALARQGALRLLRHRAAGAARSASRLVYENAGFVVIEPYAPKFPFETWVLPRAHRARFEDAGDEDFALLANALKVALHKLNVALDDPPYNFILHTDAVRRRDPPHYHWHIEIMPTLMQVAGFEWGSGFYINPTPPEEAARFLREIDAEATDAHPARRLRGRALLQDGRARRRAAARCRGRWPRSATRSRW